MCEIGIVDCGEDGGEAECEEDMADGDAAVLVEMERGDDVGGCDVAEEVGQCCHASGLVPKHIPFPDIGHTRVKQQRKHYRMLTVSITTWQLM